MEAIKIYIKKLYLENYRGFTSYEVYFDKKITVLIGENGAGKSAIIDALSESLKFLINKSIINEKYFQSNFTFYDVKNGTLNSAIQTEFEIIYPEELYTFYPRYIKEFKEAKKLFIEKYKDVIKKINDLLYNDFLSFEVETEHPDEYFMELCKEIIENTSDREINTELEILKNKLQKCIGRDDVINLQLKIELNIKKQEPACLFPSSQDELEYERLKYAFVNYEEWIDKFPVFLDFGSGIINIGSKDFSFENKIFEEKHAIYKDAFTIERFSIKEFLLWFDTLYKIYLQDNEEVGEYAKQKINLINEVICKALNFGQEKNVFSDIKMSYKKDRVNLVLKKAVSEDDNYISVEQLSSGEKAVLALIGDITRRAIMANPDVSGEYDINYLANIQGIILIDELDLHLHPKWQRGILPILTEMFPSVQFIITTHSPFVVQNVKWGKVINMDNDNEIYTGSEIYSFTIDRIFNELFDTEAEFNPEISKYFSAFYNRYKKGLITYENFENDEFVKKLRSFEEEFINYILDSQKKILKQ